MRSAEIIDEAEQCRNDTERQDQLLARKAPTVPALTPGVENIIELVVVVHRIAEYRMLQPIQHRIQRGLWGGELHIGDPHLDDVLFRPIEHDWCGPLREEIFLIPFSRGRIAIETGNQAVEIVVHWRLTRKREWIALDIVALKAV